MGKKPPPFRPGDRVRVVSDRQVMQGAHRAHMKPLSGIVGRYGRVERCTLALAWVSLDGDELVIVKPDSLRSPNPR